MRDSTQPFDHSHLTDPEEAVQALQEKRTCTTCANAQIHQRGGARVCVEDDPACPGPLEVMAGKQKCEFWV